MKKQFNSSYVSIVPLRIQAFQYKSKDDIFDMLTWLCATVEEFELGGWKFTPEKITVPTYDDDKMEFFDRTIKPGSWILFDESFKFQIMTDEVFKRNYKSLPV